MSITNIYGLVTAIIATLTFLGPIVIWFGYLKYKVDSMTQDNKDLRNELKESTKELITCTTMVKAFASTQEVINKFTADALNSIVHRLDMIESRLNNVNFSNKN